MTDDRPSFVARPYLPGSPARSASRIRSSSDSALCGCDRALCDTLFYGDAPDGASLVSAFVLELSRSLKRRAKHLFGLDSVADAHTAALAATQRTDSALRLNVHFHVLALDGAFVREEEGGPLVFLPLPTPTCDEVAALLIEAERSPHCKAHRAAMSCKAKSQ